LLFIAGHRILSLWHVQNPQYPYGPFLRAQRQRAVPIH
jgi:hypothetical protein